MCIANLAILTGRLITSFLTNVQLSERGSYVLKLSISIDKVYNVLLIILNFVYITLRYFFNFRFHNLLVC